MDRQWRGSGQKNDPGGGGDRLSGQRQDNPDRAGAARPGSRNPRRAGLDGGAVALGVPGDTADGHVDAVTGGGALFFGLATPVAVLAVLTGPLPAGVHHHAGGADGVGLGLAHVASLRALTGWGEEQVVLALASCRPGPREWSGEDQARDGFGCGHAKTPVSALGAGDSGSRWGEPTPRVVLQTPCCLLAANLSNS